MCGRLMKFQSKKLFKLLSFSTALLLNYSVFAAEFIYSKENTEWFTGIFSESYFQDRRSPDNTLLKNSNTALQLFLDKGDVHGSRLLVDRIES